MNRKGAGGVNKMKRRAINEPIALVKKEVEMEMEIQIKEKIINSIELMGILQMQTR